MPARHVEARAVARSVRAVPRSIEHAAPGGHRSLPVRVLRRPLRGAAAILGRRLSVPRVHRLPVPLRWHDARIDAVDDEAGTVSVSIVKTGEAVPRLPFENVRVAAAR